MKKPNLLVLGASGGVAKTVLHYLTHYRNMFGKVVLLDPHDGVRADPYLNHKALNYMFVQKKIIVPEKERKKENQLFLITAY